MKGSVAFNEDSTSQVIGAKSHESTSLPKQKQRAAATGTGKSKSVSASPSPTKTKSGGRKVKQTELISSPSKPSGANPLPTLNNAPLLGDDMNAFEQLFHQDDVTETPQSSDSNVGIVDKSNPKSLGLAPVDAHSQHVHSHKKTGHGYTNHEHGHSTRDRAIHTHYDHYQLGEHHIESEEEIKKRLIAHAGIDESNTSDLAHMGQLEKTINKLHHDSEANSFVHLKHHTVSDAEIAKESLQLLGDGVDTLVAVKGGARKNQSAVLVGDQYTEYLKSNATLAIHRARSLVSGSKAFRERPISKSEANLYNR